MAHIAVGDTLSEDTAALQLRSSDPRLKFILPHLCSGEVGARAKFLCSAVTQDSSGEERSGLVQES